MNLFNHSQIQNGTTDTNGNFMIYIQNLSQIWHTYLYVKKQQ